MTRDPFLLIMLGLLAAIIGYLAYQFWRIYLKPSLIKRKRDSKKYLEYEQAELDYIASKKKLRNGNRVVVIDIINDLGSRFGARDKSFRQINFEEAFDAISKIRKATNRQKIIVILHTLGGYAQPAQLIAKALLEKAENKKSPSRNPKVTVYVPYVAMSGGTIVALSADKVCMDPAAELGPIDPNLGPYTNDGLKVVIDEWKKKNIEIDPFLLLDAHEIDKYDKYARVLAQEITNMAHTKNLRGAPISDPSSLPNKLSEGNMSHGEGLSSTKLKDWGMNVENKIPSDIHDLTDARLRMMQTRLEYDEEIERGNNGNEKPTENDTSDPENRRSVRLWNPNLT